MIDPRHAVAALAALLGGAAPALACSPPLPGVYAHEPADGGTWPANAAVLLNGYEIGPEGLAVTVDGAPASLVRRPGPGWEYLALGVEPAPAPGATVRIAGSPCAMAGDECEPVDFSWTAGPPDETAPPAPSSVFLDLYDHGDTEDQPGLCSPGGDYAVYVNVRLAEAAAGDWIEVTVDPGTQRAFSRWRRAEAGDVVVPFAFRRGEDDDPFGRCFAVRVTDNAGHESAAVERCDVCRARTDATVPDWAPPGAPAWTPDDVVDFAACGPGVELPPDGGRPDAGPAPDGGPDAGAEPDAGGGDRESDAAGDDGCQAAPLGAPWIAVALLGLRRRRRAAP